MTSISDFDQKKNRHIDINLQNDVNSSNTTGLEKFRLVHCPLPEIDFHSINTSTSLFGKQISVPLLISSMTGGTSRASELNRIFAEAAELHGIAIGVGSQRIGIEDSTRMESFRIRKYAPTTLVFSNLGAVQLNYGYGIEDCLTAVNEIEADALILHLNPLQEALMENGDTAFSGLLAKIELIARKLPVPLVIKEVGWGIDWKTAKSLYNAGVAAIDIAGAGGTSWSEVEMHRADSALKKEVAKDFKNWGIPTADALIEIREHHQPHLVFASGGLQNGIDIVKCLALGAAICGIARPFLKAANQSESVLDERIKIIKEQVRVSMFAIGAQRISDIKGDVIRKKS